MSLVVSYVFMYKLQGVFHFSDNFTDYVLNIDRLVGLVVSMSDY